MTLAPPAGPLADPSRRILSLPLAAMAVGAAGAQPFSHGMPAGSMLLPEQRLVIGATPCSAMFHNVIARLVAERSFDVALFRTGFFPETVDPVVVDLGLTGPDPIMLTGLSLFRHRDASLWLVPPSPMPAFIEFDPTGLRLGSTSPFITADERIDGLCRAAAEVVRVCNRSLRGR